MDTVVQQPERARRRVEIVWVPGHDVWGRPILEMRWHVDGGSPVAAAA